MLMAIEGKTARQDGTEPSPEAEARLHRRLVDYLVATGMEERDAWLFLMDREQREAVKARVAA